MLSKSIVNQIYKYHTLNLSQQEIALKVGCSKPTVNKILNNGVSYRKKYVYYKPTKKFFNELLNQFQNEPKDLA